MDVDETIKECWLDNAYGRHASRRAAALTGLSQSKCQSRATKLGLVFLRERYRWTSSEVDLVAKWAHCSLEVIQKKLLQLRVVGLDGQVIKRTRGAIAHRIFANKFRTNLDGLCQDSLADAFGVSSYQVMRWREQGMLKGKRLPSIDQHVGCTQSVLRLPWFYSNRDISRFIFTYPGAFSLKKVNQSWFLSVLQPLTFRVNVGLYVGAD